MEDFPPDTPSVPANGHVLGNSKLVRIKLTINNKK